MTASFPLMGRWRSRKNGRTYVARELVTDATNASADRQMVLYEDGVGRPFVRELGEFLEKFERMA